ncbi:MAG TPA: DUF3473 domain-containing protein [Nannocystaceae bacterium]|nr:DUF3473 domain-containing protein [Nannocystaceae bacterium]
MTEPERGRAPLVLGIQLEDEVRIDGARAGKPDVRDPVLLERRIECVLRVLARVQARATFFAEGRLADELDPAAWPGIVAAHELGSQGFTRTLVGRLGPDGFVDDARRGREALEHAANVEVRSFRAPELAAEGCDPWFGQSLADAGYTRDSSLLLATTPEGFAHTLPLAGSNDAVTEIPVASVAFRKQRIAVLGSASLRMLPLATIRLLFEHAQGQGFLPQLLLQPSDFDPDGPTGIDPQQGWRARFEHLVRTTGRDSIVGKLEQLAWRWKFVAIADV